MSKACSRGIKCRRCCHRHHDAAGAAGRRVLRLLCRQGRYQPLQQGLQGRARAGKTARPRSPWRATMRASRRNSRSSFRCRPSRAQGHQHCRDEDGRPSRRLYRAAARRVFRSRSVRRAEAANLARRWRHRQAQQATPRGAFHGVTVEASYAVGEYDVLILSASQSDGLSVSSTTTATSIPAGAEPVLGSYIKQKMHFFIAKVNLGRMAEAGHRFLRPLQVRYETRKFMLPLRLGTVNATARRTSSSALEHKGRVEATNYRTVKLPTGIDVPLLRQGRVRRFLHAPCSTAR